MTSLAGPLIRNGRFVSLNPATGLAPSDIRSMVRSLVICLTHASEVRGAAKVNYLNLQLNVIGFVRAQSLPAASSYLLHSLCFAAKRTLPGVFP